MTKATRALDVKIIEYLSAGSNSKSSQDQSPVPVVTAEEAFRKSVVAQLLLVDKETKSKAMSKIQMVLCEASSKASTLT